MCGCDLGRCDPSLSEAEGGLGCSLGSCQLYDLLAWQPAGRGRFPLTEKQMMWKNLSSSWSRTVTVLTLVPLTIQVCWLVNYFFFPFLCLLCHNGLIRPKSCQQMHRVLCLPRGKVRQDAKRGLMQGCGPRLLEFIPCGRFFWSWNETFLSFLIPVSGGQSKAAWGNWGLLLSVTWPGHLSSLCFKHFIYKIEKEM